MRERTAGYGQYCPISRALDLLGERWTLLVVRDLLVGTTRFNALARGLPGLSRSLLARRLRQLERAGLVDHLDGEYLLTEAGRELEPIVFGIGAWGARWTFGDPAEAELDSELLVWWMHTRLDTTGFPGRRLVFHVRFAEDRRLFWIVVEAGSPSVCLVDPGFAVDVTIHSDVATLYRVWLGRLPLKDALRAGKLRFEGPAALVARMPSVFRLSPVAGVVSAATAADGSDLHQGSPRTRGLGSGPDPSLADSLRKPAK